jgi:hypothetical protein
MRAAASLTVFLALFTDQNPAAMKVPDGGAADGTSRNWLRLPDDDGPIADGGS